MRSGSVVRGKFAPRRMARLLAVSALAMLAAPSSALPGVAFRDINPDSSALYASADPRAHFGASAGRVNGLAATPGNNQIYYAASEWGGIYKTIDAGRHWFRLERHVPAATWDVEVNRSDPNTVYAASFYDGRESPVSGIEVSHDGGVTWAHPGTARPFIGINTPPGFSCAPSRIDEPSAFGIAVRPDDAQWVFVGTNCGLAISNNGGDSWRFADPTPATPASDVWDVVAQREGIVDVCGADGHFRTIDGGNSWTGGGAGLPRGRCSIAASPDEPDVLFVADDRPAATDHNVYESDDAGQSWTKLGKPYGPTHNPKRLPFLVTNQRSNASGQNRFDLWYGEEDLWRVSCVTPSSPSTATRCPAPPVGWSLGPTGEFVIGAHGDTGDLVFDPTDPTDACPALFSSDGGVFRNADFGSDCQNPDFTQPERTPHGLWLWGLGGVNRPDGSVQLYFGAQDDGAWWTLNAQDPTPTWTDREPSDSFTMVPDENRVVWVSDVDGAGPDLLLAEGQGLGGTVKVNTPQPLLGFRFINAVERLGDKQYVIVTGGGIFVTSDITASPVAWTQLGAATTPPNACGVRVAFVHEPFVAFPVFYVQAGNLFTSNSCNFAIKDNVGDGLYKYVGTGSNGTWTRIDPPGGIGVFGVDRGNPSRLLASNLDSMGGPPRMVDSTDGGVTWSDVPALDAVMTGDGAFKYRTARGPANDTFFGSLQDSVPGFFAGYPQPSLAAFDPDDPNIVVAGGRDSGLFISTNGGRDWGLISNPLGVDLPSQRAPGTPHLPRPWFVHFQHGEPGTIFLYVGMQGRGVWRIRVRLPNVVTGGPYTTTEGTDVALNADSSTDPDGQPMEFAWDLDDDGAFDDATGPTPVFDSVGQDGVFAVHVKVSAGGVFAVGTTTVTVTNAAPAVVDLAETGPKPEGTPVALSGRVVDHGWRDPLTATIDWGDGTPVEPAGGALENNRPDATLSFARMHTYGDNGMFGVTVCGRDDDTSTCQTIPISITNVAPTATIDLGGTVDLGGRPTFLTRAGTGLTFVGTSLDPGSDDLRLTWDWGDGPPSPDVTTVSLVNPPNVDPFPSASVQPRNVADRQTRVFTQPCLYTVGLGVRDDDGDAAAASVLAVVTGTASRVRGAGYWKTQFAQTGRPDFNPARLGCYLAIVGHSSLVFNELRDASTIDVARAVLSTGANALATDQLDRELIAVWLNFANGAVGLAELVDTDGNGTPDTSFVTAVTAAETVRLDRGATKAQLEAQKNILERINQMDEQAPNRSSPRHARHWRGRTNDEDAVDSMSPRLVRRRGLAPVPALARDSHRDRRGSQRACGKCLDSPRGQRAAAGDHRHRPAPRLHAGRRRARDHRRAARVRCG